MITWGGINLLDRNINFCKRKFRTKKWTVLFILHMIQFTMSNACIVYRNNMTELEEPKKDILYYFALRLSIANTSIHGLLMKLYPIPSPAEDENDAPPPKR
ncbi:hypothetical protein TNIN_174271 [Trichonephila inaurata madagascariensis]|uniref:PiggyBac transposable element-derived protein domain-containing protein n=1 Tax=Trichonephila inaurata madagascariensis TaxID=2747483 RepID=A0A8X6XLH8_9ARAC|nr:hypothetical protein TNIN_174271 [Trichonephila inaurata madagascariensis]